MKSPAGTLTIIASDVALTHVLFGEVCAHRALARKSPLIECAITQLHEYFRGERRVFDIPLQPTGTLFQQRVWDALRRIPFGALKTYGQLALAIDNPAAARAVGQAVGRNPLGIIIPCHRIIASESRLGGFAGGVDAKKALLRMEGFEIDQFNRVIRV